MFGQSRGNTCLSHTLVILDKKSDVFSSCKTYLEKHMNRLTWFQEDENNSKRLGKYVLEKNKIKAWVMNTKVL